jgi:hypothetical protein
MIRLHWLVAFVLVVPGILITPDMHSQTIVHIENRRVAGMQEGLSGTIDLQANYIQNKNTIFQTFNSLQAQYQSGIHTVLLLASYNFGVVSKSRVINDSYQHLRYTRSFLPRIAFEVFVQSQHNEGIQLRWRGLAGAGPRFTLLHNEKSRLFLGTLYMYEYEEERETDLIYREHRLSNYISFGMPFSDIISLDVILYYQPNIENFASYKYSSQASLEVRLTERFALVTALSMTHNTRPPAGIQRTYINFKNGIRFNF